MCAFEDGAIDQLVTYLVDLGSWSLAGLMLMSDPVFTDLRGHERYGELIQASSGPRTGL